MFDPENDLEEALLRADDDDEAQAAFERLLLASPLHVIGENEGVDPAAVSVKVPEGANMHLAMIERDAVQYIPLFTSVTRLQTFFDHMAKTLLIRRYLTMSGRVLFETTKGRRFVLNPGFQYMRELSADEIARLLAAN
jgi:hypothetical protein